MKKLINQIKLLNRARNNRLKELKRKGKLIVLSWTMAKKSESDKIVPAMIKKITFPFVDLGLGDAVCHTAIWQRLKNAGYIVQVITDERNRDFLQHLDCIDEIIVIDLRNVKSVSSVQTDLVINLYSWLKRKELFNTQLLAKIKHKYAISVGGLLSRPYNIVIAAPENTHITRPQQSILKLLNVDADNLRYSLPCLPQHDEFIHKYLSRYNGKKIIVVNPFASVDERSFSPVQLENLLHRLDQIDHHIFIIGEKKKLKNIDIKSESITICEFSSLWDAISLIIKADLVISVDTSIVHIACAFDKNLVSVFYSIFLDNDENLQGNIIFAPIGDKAKVVIFEDDNTMADIYLEAQRIIGD